MRLLHTFTIKPTEFYGDDVPKYAILSHTWGKEEVSFHDLQKNEALELDGLEGYLKIKACCALAAREGDEYVWIDTCCIDKTSSAELSEAINSMYLWYQEAQVCYAYLADVCIGDEDLRSFSVRHDFCESRWFTRGWTLQELLAPKNVVFYDKDWRELGSKSSLRAQISLVTGIQQGHMTDLNGASAAQKMSWASGRKTTRVEDIAYSLMGIFDVNMPLLYGEGKKAFTRLQHEIVKTSDDESIFAWIDDDFVESGIFAQSPKAFAESGNVVQITDRHQLYVRRASYAVTNRGLAIEIFGSKKHAARFISKEGISFILLNCLRQPESGTASVQQLVAIQLENTSGDDFVRSSPGQLDSLWWPTDEKSASLVYVRPVYVLSNEQQHSFFIYASSLWKRGFRVSETYGCELERYPWDGPPDERCWIVTLGRGQSFAALLLQGTLHTLRPSFGVILRVTKCISSIDLIAASTDYNFRKEMNEYRQIYHPPSEGAPGATRVTRTLQDDSLVSVSLKGKGKGKGKRGAPGKRYYSVDIT